MTSNPFQHDPVMAEAWNIAWIHYGAMVPAGIRRQVIYQWVDEIRRNRDFRKARREALRGLPLWASILLSIALRYLIHVLEQWWSDRHGCSITAAPRNPR